MDLELPGSSALPSVLFGCVFAEISVSLQQRLVPEPSGPLHTVLVFILHCKGDIYVLLGEKAAHFSRSD